MKPEEIRKLVGGYATGTLTVEERRALMEAALLDQDLFDELAREQALKDLLEDPLARRRLLDAVGEKPTPAAVFIAWWKRPATWALAGGLATAAVLVTVFVRPRVEPPKAEPVLMAKVEPAPMAAPVPAEPVRELDERRQQKPVARNETVKSLAAVEAKDAVAEMPARPIAVSAGLEDAPRQYAVGAVAMRRASVPVPYRIFWADASGNYSEQPPQAVFGNEDRIRAVFNPSQDGHLRVTSRSNLVLLDADVLSGATSNVEVPPGEGSLTVTFNGAAPFEILIRRE